MLSKASTEIERAIVADNLLQIESILIWDPTGGHAQTLESWRQETGFPLLHRELRAGLKARAFHTRCQVLAETAGAWSEALFQRFGGRDQLGTLAIAAMEILAVWNVKQLPFRRYCHH